MVCIISFDRKFPPPVSETYLKARFLRSEYETYHASVLHSSDPVSNLANVINTTINNFREKQRYTMRHVIPVLFPNQHEVFDHKSQSKFWMALIGELEEINTFFYWIFSALYKSGKLLIFQNDQYE